MQHQAEEISPPKLISALRGFDLLPAIVFLPTRRKCDEAAAEVALDRAQRTDPEKVLRRQRLFDEFIIENPEVGRHKHRKAIISSGVASHHAGHMPAWKLLIERLMSAGLLNAIFATSTVAAGVDFPARTVVISNADTRGNEGWRPLQASELQQMTGRAGRRGKDNVGFVVLVPGQFQNARKIAELLTAPPDPLESQFRATYTSLVNLLDAFRQFSHLRDIAEKSFAFRATRQKLDRLENERAELLRKISASVTASGTGLSVNDARGFERLTAAQNALNSRVPATRAELRHKWLAESVIPGRIVTQGRSGKRFYLVLNVSGETVSAMRDDGSGTSFALSRVNRVYQNQYTLRDADVEKAFYDIIEEKNAPLEEPRARKTKGETDAADTILASCISSLIPASLDEAGRKNAFRVLWENYQNAEAVERIGRDVEVLRDEIWLPFERRARVLDHFGYLDFAAEKVTERGKWLADLRVDRPLLVGEAIRRGIFDGLDTSIMAGLMSSLAADPDRSYGDLYLSDRLLDAVGKLEDVIRTVSNIEWQNHIDPAEEINLSAAAAAERWAGGLAWADLVARTNAEEGDLVRLLSRTGEALLQVARLKDSNPAIADLARRTAEIILREPVRQ
jgi:superfamily II RNA helicase